MVYVGYTPGYYGTVVSSDGVVVYGTGYYYPPYIGPTVWVPAPYTYGVGASFAWSTDRRMGAGLRHGHGDRFLVQPVVGAGRLLGMGLGRSRMGLGRLGRRCRSQRLRPLGQHRLRGHARGLGESLDRQCTEPALAARTTTP